MKKKLCILISLLCILFAGYNFFIINDHAEPGRVGIFEDDGRLKIQQVQNQLIDMNEKLYETNQSLRAKETTGRISGEDKSREEYYDPDYRSDDIDDIKNEIYDIDVEYIDDLEYLDEVVRKTDKDPEELWSGNWNSADDWKRVGDGFRIEQNENGTYTLFPDSNIEQAYEYDEENNEFVWDLDFYGKTISHKAKFINENVLVLMKISGHKVALDIYQKDQEF